MTLLLGFLLRYFIKMSFSCSRLLLKILLLSFYLKAFYYDILLRCLLAKNFKKES